MAGDGSYYGAVLIAELFESREHPGFYHFAASCLKDDFYDESKRPVKAEAIEIVLELLLKGHGLAVADLAWKESSPEELPMLGKRLSHKPQNVRGLPHFYRVKPGLWDSL